MVMRELAPSLGVAAEEVDVAVADRDIGTGRPGALTRRLMQAYRALVDSNPGGDEGMGTG